jgi:hypothetical protein
VTLRILRLRNLLPKRQFKTLAESKTRQRFRAVENLVRSAGANVRNSLCFRSGQSIEYSDHSNDESELCSDSDTCSQLSCDSQPYSDSEYDPLMPSENSLKKIAHSKRLKRFCLTDDVSSLVRKTRNGHWPSGLNPNRGSYAVGPSREEVQNFQRKQMIFYMIKQILDELNLLVFWFPYKGLLRELTTIVFKYLNTGVKDILSAEQQYTLRHISFLKKSYMSPSVTEESSIRATQSDVIFGYSLWTNDPKVVITRY